MAAGWGERGVYRLWLFAHVGENKGGGPECRAPVDFELLLWLLEGNAGVFNQISGEGRRFSANALFVDCGDGEQASKLISCSEAAASGVRHKMVDLGETQFISERQTAAKWFE